MFSGNVILWKVSSNSTSGITDLVRSFPPPRFFPFVLKFAIWARSSQSVKTITEKEHPNFEDLFLFQHFQLFLADYQKDQAYPVPLFNYPSLSFFMGQLVFAFSWPKRWNFNFDFGCKCREPFWLTSDMRFFWRIFNPWIVSAILKLEIFRWNVSFRHSMSWKLFDLFWIYWSHAIFASLIFEIRVILSCNQDMKCGIHVEIQRVILK